MSERDPKTAGLADRISALSAPSREIDRDILWEIFPEDRKRVFDGVRHISTMTNADGEPDFFLRISDRHDCPHYTGSVDDALTLIPYGARWRWLLDRRFDAANRQDGFRAEVTFSGEIEPKDAAVWAASPALALAASAIKARAISVTWSVKNG